MPYNYRHFPILLLKCEPLNNMNFRQHGLLMFFIQAMHFYKCIWQVTDMIFSPQKWYKEAFVYHQHSLYNMSCLRFFQAYFTLKINAKSSTVSSIQVIWMQIRRDTWQVMQLLCLHTIICNFTNKVSAVYMSHSVQTLYKQPTLGKHEIVFSEWCVLDRSEVLICSINVFSENSETDH